LIYKLYKYYIYLNKMQIKKKKTSLQDYHIIHKVGSGSYADVYKVKYIHSSHIYALKKIRKDQLIKVI
jgi:serine/threonine protein kinase